MSQSYLISRRKLIEGFVETAPGAWPITPLRIAKGWGQVPESYWPNPTSHGIPNEPPNADVIAKRNRLFSYHRLRTEFECLYAIAIDHPTVVALEVGKAWSRHHAPRGRIDPNSPYPPQFVHSISLAHFDFNSDSFVFPNSWGEEWGDGGIGYLPFGYLSRFLVEAWAMPVVSQQHSPVKPGIEMLMSRGEPTRIGIPVVFDLYDGDNDTIAGWAHAIHRPQISFDIEEFFIRPDYRRKNWGTKLASAILESHASISVPIRFLVPWGDHEDQNVPSLLGWTKSLGLRLRPSGLRCAAYVAEVGSPVEDPPSLEWIPLKASSPLHLLEGGVSITELAMQLHWTEVMADRRAELVEQKYRSLLTDDETAELAELQEAFGKYQDSISPLPPN